MLQPQVASPGLLLLLLGCLSASQLRAAALALFLTQGAEAGEHFTLRYQRVNATLGLYGVLCLATHITSWGAASPALLLLGALVSAATVAAAGLGLKDALASEHGVLSASIFGNGQGAAVSALAMVHYWVRDISSLAGALLWVMVAVALAACGQLVSCCCSS
jgi:hypothetical protein